MLYAGGNGYGGSPWDSQGGDQWGGQQMSNQGWGGQAQGNYGQAQPWAAQQPQSYSGGPIRSNYNSSNRSAPYGN